MSLALLQDVFTRVVEAFEKLDDMESPSYARRVAMLETVAKVRSCVLMLDLDCDDLIRDMFHHFFRTISCVTSFAGSFRIFFTLKMPILSGS